MISFIARAQTDSIYDMPDTLAVAEEEDVEDIAIDNPESDEKKDTTRLRVGKKSISIIDDGDDTYIRVLDQKDDKNKKFDFEIEDDEMQLKKKKRKDKFQGHYSGLEIGLNNYGNNNWSTSLGADSKFMKLNSSKSININLNPLQYSIPLFTSYVGLVTGLGFEFSTYRFDNDITIRKDTTGLIVPHYLNERLDYSKLTTTYLTCPLILEFHIPTSHKKNKPVHIGAGVIGGLKIGSKTKYQVSGNNGKTKLPGSYNLSPMRVGFTTRVGYRALNLYANWYLTPLFEDENTGPVGPDNPQLYPFSIGLVIIPFN